MAYENPLARPLFQQIKSEFPTVSFLGIQGDANHRKRKSDHNTGNALDIGFGKNYQTGEQILQRVLKQPGVKYAIIGKDVYYPNGRVSRNGTKFNHDTHVHVSFLSDGKTQPSGGGYPGNTSSAMPAMPAPIKLADLAGTTLHEHLYGLVSTIPGIDPGSVYIQDGRFYAKKKV